MRHNGANEHAHTMWYWHRRAIWAMEQHIGRPKINLHIHSQLIFDKGTRIQNRESFIQ